MMTATNPNRGEISAWDQQRAPVISYLPSISKSGYLSTCPVQNSASPRCILNGTERLSGDSSRHQAHDTRVEAGNMLESFISGPCSSPKEQTQGIRRRNVNVPKFLRHLYEILENENSSIIAWSHSGTAFQIKRPDLLALHILPNYFKHRNVSSFQRQLNYFGFKKWTKTQTDVCTFSHPFFVRGDEDKLRSIRRKERKSTIGMYSSVSCNMPDGKMTGHRNYLENELACFLNQADSQAHAKSPHASERYKSASPHYGNLFARRYSDGAIIRQLPSIKMIESVRPDVSADSNSGDLAHASSTRAGGHYTSYEHPPHYLPVIHQDLSPASHHPSNISQQNQQSMMYAKALRSFTKCNTRHKYRRPEVSLNDGEAYDRLFAYVDECMNDGDKWDRLGTTRHEAFGFQVGPASRD